MDVASTYRLPYYFGILFLAMTEHSEDHKKIGVLPIGIFLVVVITIVLGLNLLGGDKSFFLSGKATHGHYQIELECQACHGDPFSAPEIMQQNCESCHAKELDSINDSHPRSVFSDPRNAELLETLDARYCVTCHREHKPEITREYGVTLASDFCFHCHRDIASERPNHKDFEFATCASSGCHNFHDNSMLYETFLHKHLDEPDNNALQIIPLRTGLKRWMKKNKKQMPLQSAIPDISKFSDHSSGSSSIAKITSAWSASIHSKVNANCGQCHDQTNEAGKSIVAIERVEEKCEFCHAKQTENFLESKHGMRIALELSPMTTRLARASVDKNIPKALGCSSCHNPHSLDIKLAAVQACMDCHQDQHTKNYLNSKHYELWQGELSGDLEVGSGVTCATCHLPRHKRGKKVNVIHNQNLNLRPNTKMLRKVCMSCHGLEFSLAALTDESLVESNFVGTPNKNHQTFELIKARALDENSESGSN